MRNRDVIINEAPRGPVVNLRRYGWVPSPEENFSDDGAYFSVYRYFPEGPTEDGGSDFRLSRTNYNDETFISIRYVDPFTGRTKYIDDLNGVDKQYAVDHFPEVMEKVKAAYDKIKGNDRTGVTELSDEQRKDIEDKVYMILTTVDDIDASRAYIAVLKKVGIDEESVPLRVEREIINNARKRAKDEETYDIDDLKEYARQYLKQALYSMQSRYDHRGRWTEGASIQSALSNTPVIKSKNGKYYGFRDFNNATQKKLRDFVERKLRSLDEFDGL